MAMNGFFVTGTDTEVGKTVVCAWLMCHFDTVYWKPVQSGTAQGTDTQTVRDLTGLPETRFLPSRHVLSQPLSPHEAARRDGVHIALDDFALPAPVSAGGSSARPVIVEGAGGLLVPLNERDTIIDLIARLGLPVLLVCRSTLGTLNHTLLSLEALKARALPVAGLVMTGPDVPHNRETLERLAHAPVLGTLPPLDPLNARTLSLLKPSAALEALVRNERAVS